MKTKTEPFLAPLSPTSFKANWQDPVSHPSDLQGIWAMSMLGSRQLPSSLEILASGSFPSAETVLPNEHNFFGKYLIGVVVITCNSLTLWLWDWLLHPKSHICQNVAVQNVREIPFSPFLQLDTRVNQRSLRKT